MIRRDGDRLQVSGRLTMDTVTALHGVALQPDGDGALEIDLAQVEAVDSAAVSLLLSWLRRAQRDNVQLSFFHVPDNLLSLARMYGVAEMLPVRSEAMP
ncbi:MAG: STAS domain-containing protein [Nitrosomonadales bacterium]|nr:STAS domain-containing protein [Nitrosomonadales bacterium]